MSVTLAFKQKANKVALQAFMTSCKRYKISMDVYAHFSMGEHRVRSADGLAYVVNNIMNLTPFMNKVLDTIAHPINDNFEHHRHADTEYEYLVHAVNTLIQLIIEPKGGDFLKRKNISSLEDFGRETFTLAARKLLGDDVEITEEHDESNLGNPLFVRMVQECLSSGMGLQEALDYTKRKFKASRTR